MQCRHAPCIAGIDVCGGIQQGHNDVGMASNSRDVDRRCNSKGGLIHIALGLTVRSGEMCRRADGARDGLRQKT